MTKCELADGTLLYVREAIDPTQSFTTNSGVRQRMKDGDVPWHLQILELATHGDWSAIADIVQAVDPHYRGVRHNRRFTPEVAERLLKEPDAWPRRNTT